MLGHIELLLRLISAAVELPGADGVSLLIAAGVLGIASGAAVVLARSLLAVMTSFFGVSPTNGMAGNTDMPLLSCQSAPDAAGRPQPRAPGRPLWAAGI